MFKNFIYLVGLGQIGYASYNAAQYVYQYGFHKNCDLKARFPSEYALVTGASQGLGYGYAEELAQRGYNVIMVSRTKESLEKAAQDLQSKYQNVKIQYKVLDLESEDTQRFERFFSELRTDYGKQIGVFINNAASFESDFFYSIKPETIKSVLDSNIIGTTLLMHQQLKYASENSKADSQKTLLVNIGSQKAKRGAVEEANVYYATKQYMNHLTAQLQMQYKTLDPNIQIVNNSPGYIDSKMLWNFYPDLGRTVEGLFVDSPRKIAKQALDQIDLDPLVINGTDKQAVGNQVLSLKRALSKMF